MSLFPWGYRERRHGRRRVRPHRRVSLRSDRRAILWSAHLTLVPFHINSPLSLPAPSPALPPALGPKWDVGPISLPLLAETGAWISETLGRENTSRAGRAYLARKRREQQVAEKAQAHAKL